MRNRTLKPFFLALGFSLLAHGAVFWLAAGPRPVSPRQGGREIQAVLMPQRQRENSPVPSRPPEVPPEHSAARQNSETPQEKGALEDQSALSGGTSQESPSSPGENAVGSYLAQIRGLIDSRKEYPYQARQQEQEGTVGIRFTLSRQGLLVGEPVVEKRSRYQHLNAAALRAVQNAAPYPPFPGEIGDEAMSFQVELSFFLK